MAASTKLMRLGFIAVVKPPIDDAGDGARPNNTVRSQREDLARKA
jgi:hypothetical protein